jgi:hypothetical protein
MCQYSVDWYKVAGGGGTSSNGQYAVSGTIGQHDAGGPLTNGQYSLVGGFWSFVGVIQTPGAPTLRIYNTNGLITVAWARPAEGWLLQTTNALPSAPAIWPQVPLPYLTNDADIYILTNPPPANAFFRLFKP